MNSNSQIETKKTCHFCKIDYNTIPFGEEMSEFKKFNVVPVLPDELSPLTLISENLWYCWNHDAFSLFRDIDRDLWQKKNILNLKALL